jgi:hypothetical protein
MDDHIREESIEQLAARLQPNVLRSGWATLSTQEKRIKL